MSWNYSNTSVQTTLSAPVAPGDTSITIVDTTGLPVSFPFSLVLDYQLATVEIVTVTNVVGSTLTVTRGQDGTSAQSHSAGGPVVHGVVARDLAEPQAHIAASSNVHGTGVGANVVGTGTIQTLTNKTISGSSNTITNIADSSILSIASSKVTQPFTTLTATGAGSFGSLTVSGTTTLAAVNATTVTGSAAGSFVGLQSTNGFAVSGAMITDTQATAGTSALNVKVTGDTQPRFTMLADGTHQWGTGGAATDVSFFRTNASPKGFMTLDTELDINVPVSTFDYFDGRVTGDTNERWAVNGVGKHRWGPGNAASDTFLYRNGVNILKTDGDLQFGSGQNLDVGTWQTYTPTLVGPTIGNGTYTGRYIYLNKHTVCCVIKFTAGSTSAKNSGVYTFGLPVAASAADANGASGVLRAIDSGVGAKMAAVVAVSTTTIQASRDNAGTSFGASDFTGASFTGSTIAISFTYEV